MKVMIVVTHLLGTGHLTRALTLAQAFQKAGHRPVVVSGGVPVARLASSGIQIVQLAPVRSDGVDFSRLLDTSGKNVTASLMDDRKTQLVDSLRNFRPDVVITELFPFGRRILKDEFITLLSEIKTLQQRPAVFASIRDILAPPSKPKKVLFADDIIAAHYDGVLVHSDPDVAPLELSWPVSTALNAKLCYTGFVALPPAAPHPELAGAGEVIVSAGGGPVGQNLFHCARAAAALDPTRVWRLLIGGVDSEAAITTLRQGGSANLIVETTRSDFRQMLHHAAVSVSFCGYNTALDLLQTTCPAVFVPFDDGNEVEQGIRATALARAPGFEVVTSGDLTAQVLLAAVNKAVANGHKREKQMQMDGADKAVEIVTQAIRELRLG
ncbi:MAG: glycosyltransferase [Sulfitobacter sp.]